MSPDRTQRRSGRVGKPGDWTWKYFDKHPDYNKEKPPPPVSMYGTKPKAFCKACMEKLTGDMEQSDLALFRSGALPQPRPRKQIEQIVWDQTQQGKHGLVAGRPETMENHLRSCTNQPEEVSEIAEQGHNNKQLRKLEKLTYRTLGNNVAGPSSVPGVLGAAPYPSPLLYGPSLTVPSPLLLGFPAMSRSPSPAPCPPSSTSSGSRYSLPPSRADSPLTASYGLSASILPRSMSRRPSIGPDPTHYGLPPWTPSQQQRLEERLMRITAACGFPLTWVMNLEVLLLVQEFVHPAAIVPTRHALTRRILPRTLSNMREERNRTIAGLSNRHGTIQFDGWTALNQHHYDTFMITLDKQIYTVDVFDVSAERKSGERLFGLVEKVVGIVENEWKVEPVAACSDAGPDAASARRKLLQKRPDIISLDCYAHQINLIVGTYFKISGTWYIRYSKLADEVITWVRSKTLMHRRLVIKDAALNGGKGRSTLRAVITRWTAHYLAYTRLYDLRLPLVALIELDPTLPERERCVVFGDEKSREKSQKMVDTIQDQHFWPAIDRMRRHLKPLAIAANISQAAQIRLDQILLIFGLLYLRYSQLALEDDQAVRTSMLGAIEARWKKADQDAFIATLILNPFHMTRPFQAQNAFSVGGVYALLSRLWARFYSEPTPAIDLWLDVQDYLNQSGPFQDMERWKAPIVKIAELQHANPDPIGVWNAAQHPGCTVRPIIKLARRLLSICANSASCERLFSSLGNILTKLRNRLGNSTLLSLAEMKMHIRDEHLREQDLQRRLKLQLEAEAGQRPNSQVPENAEPSAIPVPVSAQSPPTATTPGDPSTVPDADEEETGSERLMQGLLDQAEAEDADPSAAELADEYARLFPQRLNITIQGLFDFELAYWSDACETAGETGLQNELALCELLDSDLLSNSGLSSHAELDPGVESVIIA